MKRNAMSLKAVINNIAKENKVSAQSVLQTYMLERFLERISISKYKDNFILFSLLKIKDAYSKILIAKT